MKKILLSLAMTLSVVGYGQTFSQKQELWSYKPGGYLNKEITMTSDERIGDSILLFTFRDMKYTHIFSSAGAVFAKPKECLKFFNGVKTLYSGGYDATNNITMEFTDGGGNAIQVWRTRGILGVKICVMSVGSAWCYLEENKVDEILMTLNPDYFTPLTSNP